MPLPPETLHTRAGRIRLLLLDVDGVLTDGSIVLLGDGQELKSFHVRDGTAIVLAKREGIEVGLLSGRSSEVTARRASELGISLVVQGETDKRAAFGRILESTGLEAGAVAYMGDDLLDLPVLREAGLSAAPADAVPEVLAEADWISTRPGGRGAVREFVELLLGARGRWEHWARAEATR
jgi:3-deoxy-D-manno-octulosonate 8-phosphate phosphatase (KDO 8-P phosphatase)